VAPPDRRAARKMEHEEEMRRKMRELKNGDV
jgi:hypothetical protein